ncbi:RHS repeat-associated core domain-containing protein, partial [Candidatus Saccharibacteria bacterium]|nr:RHS repeat-associated core domain-containing protein [Candidatus Saccharibacteria bacterium]
MLLYTETENGTVVENAYNGDGRRVVKTVNGAATYYLYEYDKVILETNVFGDVTGRNVYGLNLLIRTVGVDTFYYMYNGHADVTALLTPSGDVAASYYYDAFGNILEQTGDVSNSVLFAGYQYDKETGLYYLNARMYDPVTARFMQEDTYAGQQRDPLSLNLYTYCHNSPLLYFDPTGHYTEYSYETRGYYEYHGYLLSMDSANDNLAEREMRKAMWKEFPGKTASSPADLAMINAGYGDAFKHPTMVYKKVRIA